MLATGSGKTDSSKDAASPRDMERIAMVSEYPSYGLTLPLCGLLRCRLAVCYSQQTWAAFVPEFFIEWVLPNYG
jgi:hypothetical protein